jgi:hypothetical protein
MNAPNRSFAIAAVLLVAICRSLQADPPAAITDLEAKIRKACEQQDLSAIKSCYDFTGSSAERIDLSLYFWQEYWNQSDKTDWKFDAIDFANLGQFQTERSTAWQNIKSMIEPRKMGEHIYSPNLMVIGFVTVTFKNVKLNSSASAMEPIGLEPDGAAKIASIRVTP